MSENNYNDPKWTQDCGEDGRQVCQLHNLHCGYPDCAKGRREDAERKAIGSPIKRSTRTEREAGLVAALEQYADEKRWDMPSKSFAMVIFKRCGGLGFMPAREALKEYRGER